MYYGFVGIAVVMFGLQFLANEQYQKETGGTIVVSTLLSYFTEKKPNKKEWIAVILSFSGILFLTLLPV